MAKEKLEKSEITLTPEEQLKAYLKANKDDHYNFERVEDYTVSSGSLLLDIEMGGGIRPSVLRMSGVTEGGKTSEALTMLNNFLRTIPNGRGILIKSEGRLGKETEERSGISFVYKAEDWKDGTCFVYISNVFESAINLMAILIKNNPTHKRYFMVVDSLDALERREDVNINFSEAAKVAGSALLSSVFLKRMAVAFSALGHFCVLMSQVRSNIKINPYEKGDPKITNASGGNAPLHYSDWILEFQQRWQKDMIWSGEENKSEKIGHFCKLIFRKSCNEKTGKEVHYPIKYGRKNGRSIWIEYEIFQLLTMWDMISIKNKGWIEITSSLLEELKEQAQKEINDLKEKDEFKKSQILESWLLPEKIQGELKFVQYLEDHLKIVEYFTKKFKTIILGKQ